MAMRALGMLILLAGLVLLPGRVLAAVELAPDITVAADGSGDFTTVQAALASIPGDNSQRVIVLVKDGVYREKVRVDAPFVTLRGQSRKGTRLEFAQRASEFSGRPGDPGRAVINLNADDFVLENLTAANTAGLVGEHAFTVYGGRCDRTVIVDCDILSEGADTVALWNGRVGRYYHARCHFRGAVDFMCPRGWCYITDCTFFETKPSAAVWHDGRYAQEMNFVLRNCAFDGVEGWYLARHHHDAQFYFLNCTFSRSMIDRAPYRVIYPLGGAAATAKDIAKNQELDKTNVWGERAYYFNCHREGGDYAWHADNLARAPGVPTAERIDAAWTFGGTWDPERTAPPTIERITAEERRITVRFRENVSVKGKPRLVLKDGGYAMYQTGGGTDTLVFASKAGTGAEVTSFDLNGGAVIATEAAATIRAFQPQPPR
jgi:pectinesterase